MSNDKGGVKTPLNTNLKEQLKELLIWYKITTEDENFANYFYDLVRRLQEFPQAEKAVERYYRTAKSSFFDLSYLWECLRKEIATELPKKETAWKLVVKGVSAYGKQNKPEFHPIVDSAIEGIGGWKHLCNVDNLSIERSNFYKIFDSLIEEELECTILNQKKRI